MELKGSQTERNLMAAFAGESMAHVKYSFFKEKAITDCHQAVGDVFQTIADNEKAHGKVWFDLLNCENDTHGNLLEAAAGEHEEWSCMYKEFAEVAKKEGFTAISKKFELVAGIEHCHENNYLQHAADLQKGNLYKKKNKVEWKCSNCGYEFVGAKAPEKCPFCDEEQGFFMVQCECPEPKTGESPLSQTSADMPKESSKMGQGKQDKENSKSKGKKS